MPVKKTVLFLLSYCFFNIACCQTYWQQQTDYTIDVLLNDKEKTIDGFERIVYTNNSSDTLHFIWFHLWPNAYKNDRTAFSDQLLQNGNTAFYFSDKKDRGYINRLDFKVDGATAKTEDHPQHIDITKIILPKSLLPKQSISITTPFHVKLPFNFSRSGYDDQSFLIAQWYPKPAVYDKAGWHAMPYLDQGEFYSEFGSFDVNITVPKSYVVAATGELQNEDEKEWLKGRASFTLPTVTKAKTTVANNKRTAPKQTIVTPLAQGTKTLHFKQSNVHDFAWFADKNFAVKSDTLQLPSGRIINISSYYTPGYKSTWDQSLRYAKNAVRFYSSEVGEYPYNVATVVEGPPSTNGGMEYPTITVIAQETDAKILDDVIAHEIGHNWFYGILASNERAHPWMDEGINTFYEDKYMQQTYGRQSKLTELFFQHKAAAKTDQPIETSSEKFSQTNYELVAYHKTAEWMKSIEQTIGANEFRQAMQAYYNTWKFKHPQPEDFKTAVASVNGVQTTSAIVQIDSTGILPANRLRGTSIIFTLKKDAVKNYLLSPTKNAIVISPIMGTNVYDKLMIGAAVTNYLSPTAAFNFLAVPMYAVGSNSLVGLGRLNYAVHSAGAIRKTDIFFNASSFTMNAFKDDAGTNHRMRFVKFAPGIRLTFREGSPLSTVTKWLQWKTFFLTEQALRIQVDSIRTPRDTIIKFSYSTPSSKRYVNQLQFGYENSRALYPFDVVLQAEQAQDFVRTTFTGNYFFNYAKGGGLSVRLFAGKFFYVGAKTIQKQFAADRYYLNLTGANGYEDYTYADYFIGRNKFDGLASQQIMIRDGAFKVRTDLLASKVGKTDDWLMAANFVTTIPQKLNPLSVLPFKLPLRLFADVGTYAEAWNRTNDADRFLFDGGLQLSLFAETVNIYVPLFYSSIYSNYFKSTIPSNRLLKTVSFSINFYNKGVKKINRELEF